MSETTGGAPRLRDLSPKLEGTLADGVLRFACPNGRAGYLRVPLGDGPGRWRATGEFPGTLSLFPSVATERWHGMVTNGECITEPGSESERESRTDAAEPWIE